MRREQCDMLPKRPKYLWQNVCMYVPKCLRQEIAIARATGRRLISAETDRLLFNGSVGKIPWLGNGSITTDISTTINHGGYKRKATASREFMMRVHDKQ
jgi:hypothetical protein